MWSWCFVLFPALCFICRIECTKLRDSDEKSCLERRIYLQVSKILGDASMGQGGVGVRGHTALIFPWPQDRRVQRWRFYWASELGSWRSRHLWPRVPRPPLGGVSPAAVDPAPQRCLVCPIGSPDCLTTPAKGQKVNNLGFCRVIPSVPLCSCAMGAQRQLHTIHTQKAWLCSNKTLYMGTEVWISYSFCVCWNILFFPVI